MFQGPYHRCADSNQASAGRLDTSDRLRRGFRYLIGFVEGKTRIQFCVSRRRGSSSMGNGHKVDTAPTNGVQSAPVQGKACRRWLKCNWWTGYRCPRVPNSERSWSVGVLNGVTISSQPFPNTRARTFKTNHYKSRVAE